MDLEQFEKEYPAMAREISSLYPFSYPTIVGAISEIKVLRKDSLNDDTLLEIKLDEPQSLYHWHHGLGKSDRFWSIYCAADDYHDLFYCGRSKAIKRFHGRI